MRNGLNHRAGIAAAVALGFAATSPAQAQFMAPGGYPMIIVPPPAQSVVIPRKPRPAPAPAPAPVSQPASDPSAQPQIACRYQGQTRVCE